MLFSNYQKVLCLLMLPFSEDMPFFTPSMEVVAFIQHVIFIQSSSLVIILPLSSSN